MFRVFYFLCFLCFWDIIELMREGPRQTICQAGGILTGAKWSSMFFTSSCFLDIVKVF